MLLLVITAYLSVAVLSYIYFYQGIVQDIDRRINHILFQNHGFAKDSYKTSKGALAITCLLGWWIVFPAVVMDEKAFSDNYVEFMVRELTK